MKLYFFLLALLLPSVVLSQSHYMNKVFRRQARASHRYATSPRQVRFSRYIQDQPQQQLELNDVQQQSNDDTEVEPDLEQLVDAFNQNQMREKSTKSPAGQYSPMTNTYVTSTPKTVQLKDEDNENLSQLSQPQTVEEFEDADLTQNFMPTKDVSYSGRTPAKQTGQISFNDESGLPGSFDSSISSEHGDDFGYEEHDHNTIDWLRSSVRGEPGKDYPVYSSVPETSFKCSEQQYPGYYGDVEAQCQVFHICQADGRSNAFLCPNGTIFSQRHFVCVWWYEFDCASTEQYYELNSELYKETEAKHSEAIVGGSVPSTTGGNLSGRLSSPKENLNKMFKSQIDEFGGNTFTTTAPGYYSNGKTTMRVSAGVKGTTLAPMQYDVSSAVESVTPSILDNQNYETTPYNLDEALGEEIHSETPLIESLPLTTNLPSLGEMDTFVSGTSQKESSAKSTNSVNMNMNYYNTYSSQQPSDFTFVNKKFGSNGGSNKPSYAGAAVKGSMSKSNNNNNGKTSQKKIAQIPESPVKTGRNGGSVKSKMYGNGLKMKAAAVANGNQGNKGAFKSYSSYGGLKQ